MTGRQQRWFPFGPGVFSIDAAQALIAAAPRDAVALGRHCVGSAFGPHPPGRHRPPLRPEHRPDRAPTPRPSQRSVDSSPPAVQLIDRAHQLYHAWREGIPSCWRPRPRRRRNAAHPARHAPRSERHQHHTAARPTRTLILDTNRAHYAYLRHAVVSPLRLPLPPALTPEPPHLQRHRLRMHHHLRHPTHHAAGRPLGLRTVPRLRR
jgi:hypothetical protein